MLVLIKYRTYWGVTIQLPQKYSNSTIEIGWGILGMIGTFLYIYHFQFYFLYICLQTALGLKCPLAFILQANNTKWFHFWSNILALTQMGKSPSSESIYWLGYNSSFHHQFHFFLNYNFHPILIPAFNIKH